MSMNMYGPPVTESGLVDAINSAYSMGIKQARAKVSGRSGRPGNGLYRTNSAWGYRASERNPLENLVNQNATGAVESAFIQGFELGLAAPHAGGKRNMRKTRKN
jgi:hypothetical protein